MRNCKFSIKNFLVSLTFFLPKITSYKTVIQYQNQEIGINIRCVLTSLIVSLMLGWCNHHHNRNTTDIWWGLPLCNHPHSPLPPISLLLGNQKCVLYFYNFVISRMWYEWNHSVCDILRHFFLPQNNTLDIYFSTRG